MWLDVPPAALQEPRDRWDSKGDTQDTHQEAQQEEEDEAQQGEKADEDDGPELKLWKGEKTDLETLPCGIVRGRYHPGKVQNTL